MNDFSISKLTTRQKQICRALLRRRSLKQIAGDLHISYKTVTAHLSHIYIRFRLNGIQDLLLNLLR